MASKKQGPPYGEAEEIVMTELPNGDREWRLHGKLHRLYGLAVEYAEGGGERWSHGTHILTRQDRSNPRWRRVHGEPVVTTVPNGAREWRVEGKLHREDGPAVEYPEGGGEWWSHGTHHREDGPAVEFADGTRAWYRHGRLHRLDGPALESPDDMVNWFKDGLPHREDGPALIYADGHCVWFLEGELFRTEDEFHEALRRRTSKPQS